MTFVITSQSRLFNSSRNSDLHEDLFEEQYILKITALLLPVKMLHYGLLQKQSLNFPMVLSSISLPFRKIHTTKT